MLNSKDYLQKLKDALSAKTEFVNSVESQKMNSINMYQKLSEKQKPIIDVINKTTLNSHVPQIETVSRQTDGVSYNLVKTGEIIHSESTQTDFEIWKFNSKAESNIGEFVLVKKDGIEYIWKFNKDTEGVPLTPGLSELLFKDTRNISWNIVNDDDKQKWKDLISKAGLGSLYKTTNVGKHLDTPLVTSSGFSEKELFIIPENPEELIEKFLLQLAAKDAGHSGLKRKFNITNALMKKMLEKKIINNKDYRGILRKYFHI